MWQTQVEGGMGGDALLKLFLVCSSQEPSLEFLCENEFSEEPIDTTKCECSSFSLCSLDQWIHYFLINVYLLELINSLKI